MASPTDPAWRLLEAAEILHAHLDGPFEQRLALATSHLFPGARYVLDMFMPDGSLISKNNLGFDRKTSEFVRVRGAEIVLRDHPVCSKLLDRRATLGRLSDFVTRPELRDTELFQTMYRVVDVNYQVFAAVPVPPGTIGVGAISVDRDRVDFSDDEVRLLGHFVRHVEIAYATELRLRELSPRAEETELELQARLRHRGLTKRESGVLYWLSRGKRPAEIALILGISRRTVEVHILNSYRKLGVDHRDAALNELREIGR